MSAYQQTTKPTQPYGETQQPIQPGYSEVQQPIQPAYVEKTAAQPHGNKWNHGLFDCFSPFDICLLGCCCPCFLFGKTQSRENGDAEPSSCNMSCCAWYGLSCLGGWQWIYQMMKRNDMRRRFGIEGDGCSDCMTAWCCTCCSLIQEEKESLLRTQGVDAKTGQQYQAPASMTYP